MERKPNKCLEIQDYWPQLVEIGEPEGYVASVGMSTERIAVSIRHGYLIPFRIDDDGLDYQKRIQSQAQVLYYSTANFFNFNQSSQLVEAAQLSGWVQTVKGFRNDSRTTSCGYASERAVVDALLRLTGITLETPDAVVSMAYERQPDATKAYIDDVDYMFDQEWYVKEEVRKFNAMLDTRGYSDSDRGDLIENLLSLRGGILYFSNEIFKYPCRPGVEGHDELLITPETPLPWTVVAGIELLSDADKQLMQQLLK